MAYRFNGTTDYVRFAPTPLVGYASGPLTTACYFKRSSGGAAAIDRIMLLINSALSSIRMSLVANSDTPQMESGASGNATGTSGALANLTPWYILAVTWGGAGTTPRFHYYNGTSWTHENGNTTLGSGGTVGSTDLLSAGVTFGGSSGMPGDIVCMGAKLASSTDVAVEALSPTMFSTWRAFGFDWLIGFDSSLASAGVLQDQATPGTGDQTAISGTTLVADPPGWSWAAANPSGTMNKIKFGDSLAVTDEGAGVIEVNATDASTSAKGVMQLAGDLAGTAAAPQIATGVIVNADVASGAAIAYAKLALAASIVHGDVAAANKDGTAATPSLRTLGTGAQQAAAGNDNRFPPAVVNGQWLKGVGGTAVWSPIDAVDIASGTLADARLPARIGATLALVDDCNAVTQTGFYFVNYTATNSPPPPGVRFFHLLHFTWDANTAKQVAHAYDSDTVFTRRKTGGTWSAWTQLLTAAYGTSLPSSPADGQEFTLVDSTTNPTYQWVFRYNASNSTAYKWEFAGGTDKTVMVTAFEAFTSPIQTWVDLATVGPSFLAPRAGIYAVSVAIDCNHNVDGGKIQCGPALAAGTPADNQGWVSGPGGQYGGIYTRPAQITATASQEIRARYWNNVAGTMTIGNRMLIIAPVRVA